jgi:hypothetical protein
VVSRLTCFSTLKWEVSYSSEMLARFHLTAPRFIAENNVPITAAMRDSSPTEPTSFRRFINAMHDMSGNIHNTNITFTLLRLNN